MSIGNPITLTNNVASKTITTTATSGQTLFVIPGGYRINQISVFKNGIKLSSGQYQAGDGSTVVLTSGATLGEILEFQIFDDFKAANALDVNVGGNVGGGLNVSGVVTATSFIGNVTGNVTGTASTATAAATAFGLSGTPNISVGVVTATSTVVGSGVTINSSGLNVTGVVTATSFRGDGSLLSGLSGGAGITIVTSNISLTKNISYMISTDKSVLTLPASPSTGDAVDIYNNVAGIHTLARNGSTIMGIAEDVEFGEQGLRFKVWYTGSTWSLF